MHRACPHVRAAQRSTTTVREARAESLCVSFGPPSDAAPALQRARIRPPVNQDILPDDVAGVLAAQERADRAELLRRAEAAAGLRRFGFRQCGLDRNVSGTRIRLGQLLRPLGLMRA